MKWWPPCSLHTLPFFLLQLQTWCMPCPNSWKYVSTSLCSSSAGASPDPRLKLHSTAATGTSRSPATANTRHTSATERGVCVCAYVCVCLVVVRAFFLCVCSLLQQRMTQQHRTIDGDRGLQAPARGVAVFAISRVEVEVEIPNQRRALRVCHLQTGDTRAFHRERMCASTCRLNTTLHSH